MAPKPKKKWPPAQSETVIDGHTVYWRLAPSGAVNPRAGSAFTTFSLSAKHEFTDSVAEATDHVHRRLREKLGSGDVNSRAVGNRVRSRSPSCDGNRSRNVTRSRSRSPDSDLLGFEVADIVAECDAFVAEATAPFEPRFPQRRRTQPEQF